MKIGDVAIRTNTAIQTVRYYEQIGLLPPPARTASNYRHYDASHVARLEFIRRCRALDMSLQEIRALLGFCDAPQSDCCEVDALLDRHIEHVQTRLAELQALHTELRQLRRVCRAPGQAGACRILQSLRTPDAPRARVRGRARTAAHSRSVHE